MKFILAIMLIISPGCGKRSKPKDLSNLPEITRRSQTTSNFPRIRTTVHCYQQNNNGDLEIHYILKGTYHLGTIFQCVRRSQCVALGRYVTFEQGSLKCIVKNGFENEFTLCGDNALRWIQSSLGALAVMELRSPQNPLIIFCDQNIEKLLPYN